MTEVTELTFMENSDSSDSFGISSWDDPYQTQVAIQAHTGMDLRHVLTDGGGAAVSDQPSGIGGNGVLAVACATHTATSDRN